ncbi:hypothetical protein, partial [Nocardia seriolae]
PGPDSDDADNTKPDSPITDAAATHSPEHECRCSTNHGCVSAAADLWIGDQGRAAREARKASDLLAAAGETEHSAFWRYVEAHALFDRGRPEDLAAARAALEIATTSGPRTAWFRRLSRTVEDLEGHEPQADDTDRLFLVWDEWRRTAGARLDNELSAGRTALTGDCPEIS